MERYLLAAVQEDLQRKMVFLGGARQVGKTTLARGLLGGGPGTLTWDADDDRARILARELPVSDLWVFDELHEYRSWRGYLKGLYDRRAEGQRILVTGSARLDLDRHGGDSLQGRYHYLRLHPLSAAELSARSSEPLESLLALGPFPEPFLSGSARLAQVPDEAARFENLVASHLLKWIHREEDLEGRDLELRYFRDVDGREVDFVVLERRTPILFVECKLTSTPLDPGLRYLVERFPRVPAWQIALRGDRDAKTPEGVRLAPAWKLLATLA